MESAVQFISILAIIIGWGIALNIAIIRRIKAMESRLIAEFNERDDRLTSELKVMDSRLTAELRAMESRLTAELRAMENKLTAELRAMGRNRDTLVSEVRGVKGAVETLDADRRREPVEKS